MKKIFVLVILALFLFNLGSVYAQGEETFVQAKEIIKQKISCDNLTNDQLEVLGDYYMEQMHPGESHEYMDNMMGGEGSESLRQVHINMGLAFYCEERGATSLGMMGYGGMMSNTYYGTGKTSFNIFGWIITLLIIVVLVLFIIDLIKQLQEPKHRRKN